MTMIDRIMYLMKEKNFRKSDLARLTSLNNSTVYNLFDPKTNTSKIKLDTVQAIAKALNTTVDYLVYGTLNNEHEENLEELFLLSFKKLSYDGQNKVIEYINDLLPIYRR